MEKKRTIGQKYSSFSQCKTVISKFDTTTDSIQGLSKKNLLLLSFKGFLARTHHELLSSVIFGHSRSSSSSSRRKPFYEYSENAAKLLMIMIIMRLEKTYAPASLITSLSSLLDQINKMIHNSFLSTEVIKYTIEPHIMI